MQRTQVNAISAITTITELTPLRDRRLTRSNVVRVIEMNIMTTPPRDRETETVVIAKIIISPRSHVGLAKSDRRYLRIAAEVIFSPAKRSCSLTNNRPNAAPIDKFINCAKLL